VSEVVRGRRLVLAATERGGEAEGSLQSSLRKMLFLLGE
jgi:hypothetical protein